MSHPGPIDGIISTGGVSAIDWDSSINSGEGPVAEPARRGQRPVGRRGATAEEAKAMGHPMRLRILRLCLDQELTNKQLAERLGKDPGTLLHHVRILVNAGFLA